MARKIIIVDDDDIAGDLSRALLQDAGFDAELLTESRLALSRIRQARPNIVVLDILMPGIDGLSLCRQIKNDASLAGTKIAIVSAKSFGSDRRQAKDSGADAFIPKPYDIETFAGQIEALLASRPGAAAVPLKPLADSPNPEFRVKIWGSRSRSETALEPSRYGRKTPCVGVEVGGRMILFDAGTGAVAAGHDIEASAGLKELWIFLSHFHSAHINGLREFSPLSRSDFQIHFCAPPGVDRNVADLLRPILESRRQKEGKVAARMDIYEIRGERYEIFPGVAMTPFYANHPGTTVGFLLESRGRKIAYCPDDEINGDKARALQDHDEKISRLYARADLVIHNARYTPDDYSHFENQGHSNFMDTVDLAGKSSAKRLILFHQDARYSDAELDRISADAAKRAQDKGFETQVVSAQEGLGVAV